MVTMSSLFIYGEGDDGEKDVDIRVAVPDPSQRLAYWPKRLNARPQIQRAFDSWYRIHQHRFLVKLVFLARTDRRLDFAFAGITSALSASLSGYDLSVRVTWLDETWDLLASWDASPKRNGEGYICALCQPSAVFASREAVWEDHLFESLVVWTNKSLFTASELHLEGVPNQFTYAKLC